MTEKKSATELSPGQIVAEHNELPAVYTPPTLTVYGTLLDLTQGGASGAKEGAGPTRKKVSA